MLKFLRVLYSVIINRWLTRNTMLLSLNHHTTPESVLKQSLLVTVLVFRKTT